jgi:hypothetical protein
MPELQLCVETVPAQDVRLFIQLVSGGSPDRFVRHLVIFGHPIATALSRGAKIATGSDSVGFREVDISLNGVIEQYQFGGMYVRIAPDRYRCTISNIPTHAKLKSISRLMRCPRPEMAIGRLAHWFYTTAQLYSLERAIFIMDHTKGEWNRYVYEPLWKARNRFGY